MKPISVLGHKMDLNFFSGFMRIFFSPTSIGTIFISQLAHYSFYLLKTNFNFYIYIYIFFCLLREVGIKYGYMKDMI